MTLPRILLLVRNRAVAEVCQQTLAQAGYSIRHDPAVPAAPGDGEDWQADLVIAEWGASADFQARLERMRLDDPRLPVLLLAGDADFATVQDRGYQRLPLPLKPLDLLGKIDAMLDGTASAPRPSGVTSDAPGLVAQSPAMQKVLEMARRAAQTDVGIMLLGESGVGKEVVSRFVHRSSPRAQGPFIAINCAAIPETLLEATLFGYEKGAFTGASQSAPGKFEQAQGGTLLLDEVTEMAPGLQAKLLRVLQEREIERVGGRKRIALDLRIVATSNRELQQAVRQGVLREDLFYRLSVFPLRIPALRERREDILPLANSMLARYAGLYGLGQPPRLDQAAQHALQHYDWPGNVRELENVIQRSAILCLQGVITAGDLLLQSSAFAPAIQATPAAVEASAYGDGETPAIRDLDAELADNERKLIADALRECHGSKKQAAERLGISPRTLRHKLQRLRESGVELPYAHDG